VPVDFGLATTGVETGSGLAPAAGATSTGLALCETADFLADDAGVEAASGSFTAGWRVLTLTAAMRFEAAVSSLATAATRVETLAAGLRADAEEAATGLALVDWELAGFDGLAAFDADGLLGMSRCFTDNVKRPPDAHMALVGRILLWLSGHLPVVLEGLPLRYWVEDAPSPCR
jgi:hypothetical protein